MLSSCLSRTRVLEYPMLLCSNCGGCISAGWVPSVQEVVSAILTLYTDGLKPFGRMLLKRLRERAAAELAKGLQLNIDSVDVTIIPQIDPERLRAICESSKILHVQQDRGCEYFVTLVSHPREFLDICSVQDLYPKELWDDLAEYFNSVSPDDADLPCGYLACGRALMKRELPFLVSRGYCLAQVCHIVHLAVRQKRILVQFGNRVLPYRLLDELRPAAGNSGWDGAPVATLELVRACLKQMLADESMEGPARIPLEHLKQLFHSRFHVHLSEEALGYTRLQDLLNDPSLQNLCFIQVDNGSEVVVGRAELAVSWRRPWRSQPQANKCSSSAPSTNFEDEDSSSDDELFRPPPTVPVLPPQPPEKATYHAQALCLSTTGLSPTSLPDASARSLQPEMCRPSEQACQGGSICENERAAADRLQRLRSEQLRSKIRQVGFARPEGRQDWPSHSSSNTRWECTRWHQYGPTTPSTRQAKGASQRKFQSGSHASNLGVPDTSFSTDNAKRHLLA